MLQLKIAQRQIAPHAVTRHKLTRDLPEGNTDNNVTCSRSITHNLEKTPSENGQSTIQLWMWKISLQLALHRCRKVCLGEIVAAKSPLLQLTILLPHVSRHESVVETLDALAAFLNVTMCVLPRPMLTAFPTQRAKPHAFAAVAFQRATAFKITPWRITFGTFVADKISDTIPFQ